MALICFHSPQPDTSIHCKTANTGLVHRAVCLFTSQLSPLTHCAYSWRGGHLARLSWPGRFALIHLKIISYKLQLFLLHWNAWVGRVLGRQTFAPPPDLSTPDGIGPSFMPHSTRYMSFWGQSLQAIICTGTDNKNQQQKLNKLTQKTQITIPTYIYIVVHKKTSHQNFVHIFAKY